VVSLGIEGLGEQRQRFIAFEESALDTSHGRKGH
jgi:2,4-diketo-3-deoxy-L-fuconate hydrolase